MHDCPLGILTVAIVDSRQTQEEVSGATWGSMHCAVVSEKSMSRVCLSVQGMYGVGGSRY